MRKLWIILAILIVFVCYVLGQQNHNVYNDCVAKGEHTDERCYELAYM